MICARIGVVIDASSGWDVLSRSIHPSINQTGCLSPPHPHSTPSLRYSLQPLSAGAVYCTAVIGFWTISFSSKVPLQLSTKQRIN